MAKRPPRASTDSYCAIPFCKESNTYDAAEAEDYGCVEPVYDLLDLEDAVQQRIMTSSSD